MALIDEKLAKFQKAIESQAKEKAKEIRQKVDRNNEKELKEFEEQLQQRTEHQIALKKAELLIDEKKEYSRFQSAQREKYFLRQQELENDLFEKVADQLREYQDTDEYKKWFKSKLKELTDEKFDGDAILFVGSKDLRFEKEIKKQFGENCEVSEDPHILLGGFIYRNEKKHYVIDYTMDTVLRESRDWFHESVKLPN